MFTIILFTFASADIYISKAPKWAYARQHRAPRPYPSSSLETPSIGTESDYGPFNKAPRGGNSCTDAKGFHWKENALLLNKKLNKASLCRPSGNWLNYDTCGGQWDPRLHVYTGKRWVVFDPETCWKKCDKNGALHGQSQCEKKLCSCVSPSFQVGACDPDSDEACISAWDFNARRLQVEGSADAQPVQRRRLRYDALIFGEPIYCVDSSDCSTDYRCSRSAGFCVHRRGAIAGEACNQDAHCESGYRCSNSAKFCVRKAGNSHGERCLVNLHCERGMTCEISSHGFHPIGFKVCELPVSSEDPCSTDADCDRQETCRVSPTATFVPGVGAWRTTCQFDPSLETVGRRLDVLL